MGNEKRRREIVNENEVCDTTGKKKKHEKQGLRAN